MNRRLPLRADHVSSLLRPARLKQARARAEAGELAPDALRAVEDECIIELIGRQEAVGLGAVTDGEFRRGWWHFDFLWQLEGVTSTHGHMRIVFEHAQSKDDNIEITGKLGVGRVPMIDDFRFVAEHTKVTPKIAIPGPPVLHFRGGRELISKEVYPDLDEFFFDAGEVYKKILRAFYDAGCRYLQFDDTVWAYLCSEKERELSRGRGDDPDSLPPKYARMINSVLSVKPDDMTVTTHVCRGNFRSSWISSGGYEPVAETLLAGIDYDGYFLEYDTDRAGGFEPLRFLPRGDKRVVLGLVTSKEGALEDKDLLKRRIEEATQYADLDQLCLSPQCGFSSTEEGNLISDDEQWRKLELVVETAAEVWPDA
jgi:5-methyltetrahydropteroyltriglutamate--homocysteine methyltransferase